MQTRAKMRLQIKFIDATDSTCQLEIKRRSASIEKKNDVVSSLIDLVVAGEI
jgi:hypothetical protein